MVAIVIFIDATYSDNTVKNQNISDTLFRVIALSLLMVASLSALLHYIILKPISRMMTLIREQNDEGIPSKNIDVEGTSEIQALSRAINNVVNSTRESRTYLKNEFSKLKDNEEQLILQGAAMSAASESIAITDVQGKVKWVNPAFESLTGYQFEEIYGKSLSILNSEQQSPIFFKNLWQTILSGNIWHGELRNKRKDGSLYLEEQTITPVLNANGKITHFVALKHDISVQRQNEIQIQRSQKMDSLGKLTGGVAHDYNNMLGVILGYAELLQTKLDDDSQLARYVSEIRYAGNRGAKLTRKLLSFSRIQATESEITNINSLITEARLMLEKTLTASIQLKIELENELWPVWVDGSDLEDAILNMSINAMHAMPEGGELTLTTSNTVLSEDDAGFLELPVGDYVMLSISDTGIGMDEEVQRQIFDPFFSTKGNRGTGLGLSQVYSFVQRAKGTIKLFSKSGQGTQFVLYFPRFQSAKIVQDVTNLNMDNQSISGRETILIVDDEPSLRSLTKEILSSRGYNILSAEDGEQALSILENEHVDLLLSDVIMPNIDGFQLAAIVREKYPDVIIQLVSGFNDSRQNGLEIDELQKKILHKPFNAQELLNQIRSQLDACNEVTQNNHRLRQSDSRKHPPPIEWSDEFSIDVDEIDADHQKLMELINLCHQATDCENSDNIVKNILYELVDYTQSHFKKEELIMEACGYPYLDHHRSVHQSLIKQTQIRFKEFESGVLTVQNLYEFFIDWLTEHIITMDKGIASYAKGKEKAVSELLENSH